MPSISYQQMQRSGLVSAAAVGSFTRPNVRQLIVMKEMELEVWETEEETPIMVTSTGIGLKVCNCALLQNPWGYSNPSPTVLDRLLVTDDKGSITVLEWLVSGVEHAAIKVLSTEREKMEPVLYHSIFSRPMRFGGNTPLGSLLERSRENDTGAKDWFGKIRSITLVAMAVYESLIQILVAAWVPITLHGRKNSDGTVSHKPLLNEYHMRMKEDLGIGSIASQIQTVPTILDLAFMEGLDWKAHPLLVVLSAQDGLIYELITVECFALDLAEGKILRGPWRIRNLHRTSRFLLPWSQESVHGVLVISSKGLLFINSMGFRASLCFTTCLDGPLSCLEPIKDHCLVLGDSSGVLYIVDLKSWDQHLIERVKESNSSSPADVSITNLRQIGSLLVSCAKILLLLHVNEDKRRNVEKYIFFSSRKTSNARFFTLYPPLKGEAGLSHGLLPGDEDLNLDRNPTTSSLSSSNVGDMKTQKILSWYTEEILTQLSSDQDVTYVRDMILINDLLGQHLLLIACGSDPHATIRRGISGVTFNTSMHLQHKVRGIPHMIPLKWNHQSEYHTHILLGYGVQDRTEVIDMNGEVESCIHGLEREHNTLAALAISSDTVVQVTSYSLRVLSISKPRILVAEWIPPRKNTSNATRNGRFGRERNCGLNIIHASLCTVGALLATQETVYSVTFTKSGQIQTSTANARDHEVSALGVFEFWIAGENVASTKKRKKLDGGHLHNPPLAYENADLFFIVVVAQWHTNTVHLLTWPDLEDITSVEAGSAPVRCVQVSSLGNQQCLIVGSSDGSVTYYEMNYEIPKRRMEVQDSTTNQWSSFSDNETEQGEDLSCLILMSDLRNSLCYRGKCDRSLKRGLKILSGKRLKLGGSIQYMVSGPICGPVLDSGQNMRLDSQQCLLIQGDRSFVLCSKEDGEVQALPVLGSNQPLVAASRIHTQNALHGLLVFSTDGHLLLGHLSMSAKLHWQVTEVLGTPQQLAYHHGSGCVAVSSNDRGYVRLCLVHIQSMCQVLTLELGFGQHPTALKVLRLPSVQTKDSESCRECIIVASQKSMKEPAQGTIHFFEFNQRYPCDQEIQYELGLLGVHFTELPCHALCLVESHRQSVPTELCDICNISSFVEDLEPLAGALKHLNHRSHHWNDCLRHQGHESGPGYHNGPFLVLGYNERVEIFSVVVGKSMMSIRLAPYLANAVEVAVPSLSGPIFLEGYESSSPYVSDTESDHEDDRMCNNSRQAEDSSQPIQELKSLICLTKITEFTSPGRSCVNSIVAISPSNFLVVEMLRGVSAFSIQDNAEVLQFTWHPFSYPVLDLVPLNPDLYVVSTYEKGLQLMHRNYEAEQAFQEEVKRLCDEDVERGVGGESQRLDADERGNEMPGFTIIAAQLWPATVLRMQEGHLNQDFENINPYSKDGSPTMWHAVTVTPTGEVGVVEVSLREGGSGYS